MTHNISTIVESTGKMIVYFANYDYIVDHERSIIIHCLRSVYNSDNDQHKIIKHWYEFALTVEAIIESNTCN